jgi:hypothetical protein
VCEDVVLQNAVYLTSRSRSSDCLAVTRANDIARQVAAKIHATSLSHVLKNDWYFFNAILGVQGVYASYEGAAI